MLASERIPRLRDFITGPSNLDHILLDLHSHVCTQHCCILFPLLLLSCCSPSEVRLMLTTLCVCKVRAIILVDSQTESAFKRTDVVLEEVRVLVEVDGFQRKLSKTFTSVCIGGRLGSDTSTTELASCSILVIHGGCERIEKNADREDGTRIVAQKQKSRSLLSDRN